MLPVLANVELRDYIFCLLHLYLNHSRQLIKDSLVADLPTEQHAIDLADFLRKKRVSVRAVTATDLSEHPHTAHRLNLSKMSFNGVRFSSCLFCLGPVSHVSSCLCQEQCAAIHENIADLLAIAWKA